MASESMSIGGIATPAAMRDEERRPRVSWHCQGPIPGWLPELVRQSGVESIKLIDPPSYDPLPGIKTIARLYIPDSDEAQYIKRGARGGVEYFERWQSRYNELSYVYAFEAANEPDVSTPEARANLVAFTRAWVQRMHGIGKRTVALSLSVGWPDVGCAPDLKGALTETDFWAVHEYSAPTMRHDETWLCLRYRRTVAELLGAGARVPPLLITECGVDGGVCSRAGCGWKAFGISPQDYSNMLADYDRELQRDSYVKAAFVFTSAPNGDWQSFDMDETVSRLYATYRPD